VEQKGKRLNTIEISQFMTRYQFLQMCGYILRNVTPNKQATQLEEECNKARIDNGER
jgi:hypothetical protein